MAKPVFDRDDLATLATDGVLIKRAFFDAEEIGLLKAACTRDQALAAHTVHQSDSQGRSSVLTAWNHPGDDLYGMFARCQRMVGGMEQFLGGEVYHYHSKVVWKRPGDGSFAWHQDYGYWYENGCLFPDMASCSIAIDKADRENACLQVVKGSHRLGRVDHVQVAGQATVEPERLTEILKVQEVVYCEMDPGDAVFTPLQCDPPLGRQPLGPFSPRLDLLLQRGLQRSVQGAPPPALHAARHGARRRHQGGRAAAQPARQGVPDRRGRRAHPCDLRIVSGQSDRGTPF